MARIVCNKRTTPPRLLQLACTLLLLQPRALVCCLVPRAPCLRQHSGAGSVSGINRPCFASANAKPGISPVPRRPQPVSWGPRRPSCCQRPRASETHSSRRPQRSMMEVDLSRRFAMDVVSHQGPKSPHPELLYPANEPQACLQSRPLYCLHLQVLRLSKSMHNHASLRRLRCICGCQAAMCSTSYGSGLVAMALLDGVRVRAVLAHAASSRPDDSWFLI